MLNICKSVYYNVILKLVIRILPIFDDHYNFSQRPFSLVWGTVFLRRMTPETESVTAFPRNTLRFCQLKFESWNRYSWIQSDRIKTKKYGKKTELCALLFGKFVRKKTARTTWPTLLTAALTDRSAPLDRQGAGWTSWGIIGQGRDGGTWFLGPAHKAVGSSELLLVQLRRKVKTRYAMGPSDPKVDPYCVKA